MHELGITRNIVSIVTEHANGSKVIGVKLEIGKLSAIMPDAIRFCFEPCTEGTCMEGAELEIIEVQGQGECLICGAEVTITSLQRRCDCGSRQINCTAGEELNIKEMVLA